MRTKPFLLGVLLIAGLVPAQAAQFGDFTYESNGTSVTITKYTGPGGAVIIPDTINGLVVTAIGEGAFAGCTRLTSITIPDSVTSIGNATFADCTRLTGVYFKGDAPRVASPPSYIFVGAANAIVYLLPGTMGWGATYGERPTALWPLPNPVILTTAPSFGVQTNRFGFIISWATNIPVVVEAATTPALPIWSPVETNTLTNGWFYFSDPAWTNHPARFYRLHAASVVATNYQCADLGTLGGAWSWAYGINEAGQAVGAATTAAGTKRAFLWSAPSGMVDLGTLGGTRSWAYGINEAGQVVGGAEAVGGGQRAFVWKAGSGMVELHGDGSEAAAINDPGQVAVTTRFTVPMFFEFLVSIWSPPENWTTILPRDPFDKGTWAAGINSTGHVVGEVVKIGKGGMSVSRAFHWGPDSGLIDLGTLGGDAGSAAGINDLDQVVGWASLTAGVSTSHAFIWRSGSGMVDLGTLGGDSSRAAAINNLGQVVGSATTSAGRSHAFLWSPEAGMIDLGTLGGDESVAQAINDAGHVVGVVQVETGEWHACLWRPCAQVH